MKILFLTRKYPPSVGGMETFAYSLYNELQKQTETKLVKWGGSNKYLPLILPWLFAQAAWQLITTDIDIIHLQDGVLAPLGYILSRLFNKPMVIVIHGLDVTYPNSFYQAVIPRMINKAKIIFCISQATADQAIKRGIAETKIKIIPLGMSDNYYQKATDLELRPSLNINPTAKVLITVGRLVKRKGIAWFIEKVMPSLVAQNRKLLYLVAGEGSQRPAIEQAITLSHLDQNVRLLGRVSDQQLSVLYNGADIFVMPNIKVLGDMEGFGLVCLEAAIAGLPVVASKLEGITDAITDGQNGILVTAEDARGFESAISHLLNPETARQLGQQARDFSLQKYRWSNVATAYLASYQALLSPLAKVKKHK
ncbi:MAG TPA: glycosyltransferase family 4 protein [Candidatus Dormibacteraeota bacterium]|nr:glycosyltransferase family 4 protein [Candidatus Dormibacteraeota bacterium]